MFVLFREEEQQMQPVAQMALWEGEGFLCDVSDLIWMAKPHIFKYMNLEAVAVIRVQSPTANGLRI